jgi:hypothetical protein
MRAVASSIFHYLESRKGWNNFDLVTKEINKVVKEQKGIALDRVLIASEPREYRLS